MELPKLPLQSAKPTINRIVRVARERMFAQGYDRLTMDELARELGMSKKTLYLHFPSKESLARHVILDLEADVRAHADQILNDAMLDFPEKLQRFIDGMLQRLNQLSPQFLRDLQRFVPELYEMILAMRRRNVPPIFRRLLTEGQRQKRVRRDLDPDFAAEFLLHAMQGLMDPKALAQLNLPPRTVFASAMNIFFRGILTPAAHQAYEKSVSR